MPSPRLTPPAPPTPAFTSPPAPPAGSPPPARPLRVLHAIASLGVRSGGPSSALAGLAAAQAAAGLSVNVLTADDPAAAAGPSLADGLAARGVRATAAVDPAVAAADVVHLHGVWERVLHAAAVAARRRGVPYLFTPHGMLDPWALRQKALKKRLYRLLSLDRDLRHAAAVNFSADRERDQSLSPGGGGLGGWLAGGALSAARWREPGRTIVEPFGIDVSEFDPPPPAGAFRARYPAETAGRRLVAFLGRLHPGKGAEHLIPAMRHVADPSALLVVAGPDSDAADFGPRLRQTSAAPDLAGRVLFTGMLRGPARLELLADADLFALPSEHENFGIVVAEAMACGCPVLASDEVNLCSAVTAMDAGAVVPMAPAADLPERLARAIDAELATGRDAAERGRVRAAALAAFDWAGVGRRWAGHYEAIVRRAAT